MRSLRPIAHRLRAQPAHLLNQQRLDFISRAQRTPFILSKIQNRLDPLFQIRVPVQALQQPLVSFLGLFIGHPQLNA